MWSPAFSCGCPGPGLNSSSVSAPALGPESIAISACEHWAPPVAPGTGDAVKTFPAEGLPHGPIPLETTWPATVVTAPPLAFWKGSGMSTF